MEKFKDAPFLAPITTYRDVLQVRISGLSLSLIVGIIQEVPLPQFFWWITPDLKIANPIREASQAEISAYLALFPRARMLVMKLEERGFWATRSRESDISYPHDTPVFVHATMDHPNVALFDEVICRFDGRLLFFERIVYEDAKYMQVAEHMRQELGRDTPPVKVKPKGATQIHFGLYVHLWDAIQESKKKSEREILEDAVAHAGGVLDTYKRSGNMYSVHYSINGTDHVSRVQIDLQAISTQGVCLAGEDNFFDLQSIVSLAARWDQGERD